MVAQQGIEDAIHAADGAVVGGLDVHAFELPTDGPDGKESDGTFTWTSTTMAVVAHGGGRTGLGYTYADASAAGFVGSMPAPVVAGASALSPPVLWRRMADQARNAGRPGAGMMAISAVDLAPWDLKARLLDLPVQALLAAFHDGIPVYGSGGFTDHPLGRLTAQLAGWIEQGIPRVKLKTSRRPAGDPERLRQISPRSLY